jgi:hypothetical protein
MEILNDGTNVIRRDRPRSTRKAQEQPQDDGAFRVGDHNIDDVKAYVEANPDQADALLAEERDGQGRVTLIEWFESRQAAADEDDES